MTPPLNTIVNADVLAYLRGLPDECAHCCVTSPPYWGLRDYGLAPSHWEAVEYAPMAGLTPVTVPAMDACLGLEPTPDAFVGHIVAVFREVRRVLRADGTLWLNLGDRYTGSGCGGDTGRSGLQGTCESQDQSKIAKGGGPRKGHRSGFIGERDARKDIPHMAAPALKTKNLVGIPWRVAFALQADGWYLRSDVIWAKPNPMPESVTDRPTKAHEYVFMLSKSQRYFYDADGIKEARTTTRSDFLEFGPRPDIGGTGHMNDRRRAPKAWTTDMGSSRTLVSGHKRKDKQSGHSRRHAGFNERWDDTERTRETPCTRNVRTVWDIATAPFAEAHFATFPPELPKRCIMAGCPQGGTVLEPFSGAGTVPLVATGLGRNWLACELNPEYVEIANRRLQREVGLLLEAGNA